MKKMIAIVLALMLCVTALSVCAFAAEDTITVHVSVAAEGTPYAWAWGDYGNAFSAWPGDAMTLNGDWWEIEVPVGTVGFIVNDGGDPAVQTADIDIDGQNDVWITCASFDDQNAVVSYGSNEGGNEGGEEEGGEELVITDCYVAGSEGLCGVNWDPAAEANKMTKGEDGIYTMVYENVAAGEYELKVTDGSWDNSWGYNMTADNFKFTVAEGGKVVVTFNPATFDVDVVVDDTPVPETGDLSIAAVSVALLAATAGMVLTIGKKKEI